MANENFESVRERIQRLKQTTQRLSSRVAEAAPKIPQTQPGTQPRQAAEASPVAAQAADASAVAEYREKLSGHAQQLEVADNRIATLDGEKKQLQRQLDDLMQDNGRLRSISALLEEEKNELKMKMENQHTELEEARNKTSYTYVLNLVEEFVREFMRHSRDILGIMYESVHLCMSEAETDESLKGKVKLTEEQVKYLLEVLTESAKKFHFDKVELKMTDLSKVVATAVSGLGNKIPTNGITISSKFPDKPVIVSTEYNLLSEALTELLVNAVEAMYQGGQLGIECEGDEKVVTLRITDTGCGIPPHLLNKVFKPFMTTKKNHFGLGLTRVYWTTRLLKYDISLESTVNKATAVTLTIPVSPADWSDRSPVA